MPSDGPEANVQSISNGLFVPSTFTVHTKGFVNFFGALKECLDRVEIEGPWSLESVDGVGEGRSGLIKPRGWYGRALAHALGRVKGEAYQRSQRGKKVIFVGNGGSAAICSHMTTDWMKNAGMRSMCLNDGPMLTCLANDYGFEHVFAKQLEFHAAPGDLVVIVSTSGKSPNILEAIKMANKLDLDQVRFSGQNPTNPLRRGGSLNFYVPCNDYGLVEMTHMALLHSIVSVSR